MTADSRGGSLRFAPDVCAALAGLALAVGFAQAGHGVIALIALALGAAWIGGRWYGWPWASAMGLVSLVGAAAGGLCLDLSPGWPIAGLMGALAAWDLDAFLRWLGGVDRAGEARALAFRHLGRLAVVEVVGALLAWLALEVRVSLSLGWIALLGLLVFLGLNRAIVWASRSRDEG